jgi:ribokinase
MDTIEVVGMGAMNNDRIYRVERIIIDGEVPIDEPVSSPGGSAANTIYALAKLGVKTGFVGAVGDDEEGKALLQDFQDMAVDTKLVRVKGGARTGSVLCLSDRRGKRSLYVSPGVNNLLDEKDVELEYINQAKILHLSTFAHSQQFEIQKRLVANLGPSVRISLAPGAMYASKGIGELSPMLRKTYALFLNLREMRKLTGEGFAPGAKKCLERGCHIVVVTMGGGSTSYYITDGEKEYTARRRTQTTPPVDTTGAGDAFAAGFLFGLLKNKTMEECGFLGDFMARCCIGQIGARNGLPSLQQLCREYQSRYGLLIEE